METLDPTDPIVLGRYLANELSDAERIAFDAQVRASDVSGAWQAEVARLSRAWRTEHAASISPTRMDEVWRRIAREIPQASPGTSPATATPRAPRSLAGARSSWRGAVVGAAALVAALGVTWQMTRTRDAGVQTANREYATQRGQRATVALPDGSKVILAPASRLRYSVQRDGARLVTLDGQAYFMITPDRAHPFTVQALGVTTRVLGTTFSVRAYPSDTIAHVAVAEGRVAVEGTKTSAILAAGDVGRIARGVVQVAHDPGLAGMFGWTTGQVTFRQARLGDIVPELERLYDVDIRVTDPSLNGRTLTITLADNALQDVLSTIALALDARYEHRGRAIVMSPRRSPSTRTR